MLLRHQPYDLAAEVKPLQLLQHADAIMATPRLLSARADSGEWVASEKQEEMSVADFTIWAMAERLAMLDMAMAWQLDLPSEAAVSLLHRGRDSQPAVRLEAAI